MSTAEPSLIKAKINQHRDLKKSRAARDWLKKRQLKRGGIGDNEHYRLEGREYNGNAGPGTIKKADGRIRTIQDLIDYHYGFVPEFYAKEAGLEKADDPLSTTTTGVNNVVYGQQIYSLLNQEGNLFSLLEKRPWQKSGERIIVNRGQTLGEGGLTENATLPETDKPEFREFENDAATVGHSFDVTQLESLLADTDDDRLDDPFDFLRRYFGEGTEEQSGLGQHPKHLNVQLASSAERDESNGGVFENAMEPLDRIVSDSTEASLMSDASDADIYGFDRSAGEFEANVLENGATDRNVTVDVLDDALTAVREASGKEPVEDDNYFWLTGHDTFQLLEEEVGSKERLEPVRVQTGLNGVQTVPGDDVGITVQAYKDIPIFRTNDLVSDSVSRIFLVDSSTVWIKQLLPTQFYSTGIEQDDNPFALDRLGDEGLYLTIGQLTCTQPNAHAKIRDLK